MTRQQTAKAIREPSPTAGTAGAVTAWIVAATVAVAGSDMIVSSLA